MARLRFTRRPIPVLPDHRPLYKIAQVLLILAESRGGKSSLPRLHLFNWALKSQQRLNTLRTAVHEATLSLPTWGFDPALAIALRYAVAECLIKQVANGYQLEDKGRKFLKDALKDQDVFVSERIVLSEIGKGVTETMVDAVSKDWD